MTVLVLTLVCGFTIPPAEAGSKDLLKALALGGLLAALPPPPVFVSPVPDRHYYPPREEYVPGHWEVTREWVPEIWERVWTPDYRDGWGRWVPGRYENRQTPGYCQERKVWVEGYYRPY